MKVKKVLHFSIGPIGGAILGFISLPIVTWFFSSEDIGRLTIFQVAINFCLLLFGLGLDQAYVREFYEVENKPVLLKTVMLPGQSLLFLFGVILTLLPWSISAMLFGIDSSFLTILLFVGVLIAFHARFLSLVIRMQERGLAFSMSQLLPKLLFLIIIGFYVGYASKAVFEDLMLAYVISMLAVLLIFIWNTRSQWVPAITASVDKKKLNHMIQYTIPLIGGGIAFWGLTAIDRFFLRALSSYEELGIYSVSVSFAGGALVFQSIFSTVWAPTVYKWAAEGIDPNRIKNTMDYVTLAVIVIWSLTGIFSWLVSYILPSEYEKVQFLLLVAMAYPLLYTLSEATGVGIGIKRKTMYSLLAAILSLIVNIAGNIFLIPNYGATGAAIASSIAFMVFFLVKTEASARLWMAFSRAKMYLVVLTALVISIVINISSLPLYKMQLAWTLLLVLVLLMYKKHVIQTICYLKAIY